MGQDRTKQKASWVSCSLTRGDPATDIVALREASPSQCSGFPVCFLLTPFLRTQHVFCAYIFNKCIVFLN